MDIVAAAVKRRRYSALGASGRWMVDDLMARWTHAPSFLSVLLPLDVAMEEAWGWM